MNKFFKRFFVFNIIFFLGMMLSLIISKFFVSTFFDYKLNSETNILILGDSHTQCGLNDGEFKNSLNLSESADTYFYSYVKLKKLLQYNKQIDTLILGYSNHNISQVQDEWLKSSIINSFKLPIHFFLFDGNDSNIFARTAPLIFFENIPKIIKMNITHCIRIATHKPINQYGIGGYLALKKKIDITKFRNTKVDVKKINYSNIDVEFLKKIYALCKENNIKLIILNTPVFNFKNFNETGSQYISFANKNLKNATLMDYSKLSLDKKYFADEAHLNNIGSTFFTKILVNDLKNK